MKNPGIYVLTSPTGKQYVGRDVNLPSRATQHLRGNVPECPAIHRAIQIPRYLGGGVERCGTLVDSTASNTCARWL